MVGIGQITIYFRGFSFKIRGVTRILFLFSCNPNDAVYMVGIIWKVSNLKRDIFSDNFSTPLIVRTFQLICKSFYHFLHNQIHARSCCRHMVIQNTDLFVIISFYFGFAAWVHLFRSAFRGIYIYIYTHIGLCCVHSLSDELHLWNVVGFLLMPTSALLACQLWRTSKHAQYALEKEMIQQYVQSCPCKTIWFFGCVASNGWPAMGH